MKIWVRNTENGINEEFETNNLEFIRRSYDEYASKDSMSEKDFLDLALLIVKKRYEGTRFDNLEWAVEKE